jgi:hypothetical protein
VVAKSYRAIGCQSLCKGVGFGFIYELYYLSLCDSSVQTGVVVSGPVLAYVSYQHDQGGSSSYFYQQCRIGFTGAYATYRTSSTTSLYEEQRSAWKYQFSQFFSEHTGTFIYLFSNPSHSLVWEFLSSLASLADQKQQVVLLTEVRDKVLESAMAFKCQADTNATFSVNTFLNCLGLNVDQLIAA